MDLGLEVRSAAETPIYQQLFEQVADRVRTGAWPVGYRLPATRTLAQQLGTHRNTVVRAFEELVAAGYLVSSVGRGTFVAERPTETAAPAPSRGELPWSTLLSASATAEPLARLERYRRQTQPSGAINLARMQPSADLMPHALLRRCLDHVMRNLSAHALGYAPREGVLSLREQLAVQLGQSGVPARPEDIIVTTGSQQALDIVARALVDPGDRFFADGMTYTGALNLFALRGAQVLAVPNDTEGPDLDWLCRRPPGDAKGLYLMPNCHNPTGGTISPGRRKALIRWSHEAGVPLIEDDYGADLELEQEPAPPYLRAMDPEVIYLSTFSKKLIPALRIGFIVAPRAMHEALASLKHAMDLGTSALLQHALAEFLERGYLRAHYQKVLPEYRRRRDALVEGLEEAMPAEVSWDVPRRGVVLWLHLPPELTSDEVYEAGRRAGVLVSPSTLHAVGPHGRTGVRLTFCFESPDRLREGALRLSRAMAQLLRRPRPRADRVEAASYGI